MKAESVFFNGHNCFQNLWAGFDSVKAVNVIIGKNNTGKSHLLDLVQSMCFATLRHPGWKYKCFGLLDEPTLRRVFRVNHQSAELPRDEWIEHGSKLIGSRVSWEIDWNDVPSEVKFLDEKDNPPAVNRRIVEARLKKLTGALHPVETELSGKVFRRLHADRDISPEIAEVALTLAFDGSGATNIIRRFITSSHDHYDRNVIQRHLLNALNEIFKGDAKFSEIQIKHHDDINPNDKRHSNWEVYLGEESKGLIPLSQSGSGLKTIILTLLNVLVIPAIDKKKKSEYVFAFEELENNLHPSLFRRLLVYLSSFATREKASIFLTTHSSTALDLFGISEIAQIIHVTHDGVSARTAYVSAHLDQMGVAVELGVKPSDLLQANGIIWVEGPSDCIYLNKWIELASEGQLREGRDYQTAFYGGALLARIQFAPREEAEAQLINLFRVNPNIIVVCDGDRNKPGARVKDRVRRIRTEVKKIPGSHIWVTEAREIENYLTGRVLGKALDLSNLPDPSKYEIFCPRKNDGGISYLERRANRKSIDKTELAITTTRQMTLVEMKARFDWESEIIKMVEVIKKWNSI